MVEIINGIDNVNIKTGDHKVLPSVQFEKSAVSWTYTLTQAHKDIRKIMYLLEKVVGGAPDFDSGYFSTTTNETHYMFHNLGAYPSRVAIFFCESEEPVGSYDDIYPVSPYLQVNVSTENGAEVLHADIGLVTVRTGSNYIANWQFDSGYLRVMLWR